MSTAPSRHAIFSLADYLAREEVALTKSEFFNGEIVAMAGATMAHNIITTNIVSHLHALLRRTNCRPFGSDLRIEVANTNSYVYPDVTVICGEPVPGKHDPHSVANPRLIVEVLSESSESRDRGRKFKVYLKLDSLKEYVLVSQHEPRIERFFRKEDGTWTMSVVESLNDWLQLESVDCRLAMAEIYDGVKFEAPSSPE